MYPFLKKPDFITYRGRYLDFLPQFPRILRLYFFLSSFRIEMVIAPIFNNVVLLFWTKIHTNIIIIESASFFVLGIWAFRPGPSCRALCELRFRRQRPTGGHFSGEWVPQMVL
eukprot:SAG11_NODE_19816_length_458_cov_1.259053_1_plen_112_part_01